eukprot:8634164-Alexandrium_andersonii.AAC.1
MKTRWRACEGRGSTNSMQRLTIDMASMVDLFDMNPYWVELTAGPKAIWSRTAIMRDKSLYAASRRLMGR